MTNTIKETAKELARDLVDDANMRLEKVTPMEGWKYFDNARKAHYIKKDGNSLCGKWAAWSMTHLYTSAGDDECTTCRKHLATHKKN